MNSLLHINWGALTGVAILLAAFSLSYTIYRRDQATRRTAQASLVTGWWTRVRQDTGEDCYVGDVSGSEYPKESGYRVRVSNSSNDAVYDCIIFASIDPTPSLVKQLKTRNPVYRPFVHYHKDFVAIAVGTIPPQQQTPFFIDGELVESIGKLRIEFMDSNGIDWRRVGGKLTERPTSRPAHAPSHLLGPPDPL